MHEILLSHGYKLVDDAWTTYGRKTYVHDDNADRKYLVNLEKTIRAMGWVRSRDQLRMFRHQTTADIIEIEPGGPKIGGHLLHHQKWESQ
jgi:hypothetical protein